MLVTLHLVWNSSVGHHDDTVLLWPHTEYVGYKERHWLACYKIVLTEVVNWLHLWQHIFPSVSLFIVGPSLAWVFICSSYKPVASTTLAIRISGFENCLCRRVLIEYLRVTQRLRWSRGERAGLWNPSSRVQTRPNPSEFSGEKNPQHAFLRRGSKAVGPMS